MTWRTSLKAFTLLEVLINITIMSIIIGLVYYIFSSLGQQFRIYQNSLLQKTNLRSFQVNLNQDFFLANRIYGEKNQFELINYNDAIIYYNLNDGFLYRTQGSLTDSIEVVSMKIFSEDYISNENLVTGVSIRTSLFNESIDLNVQKRYPSILKTE